MPRCILSVRYRRRKRAPLSEGCGVDVRFVRPARISPATVYGELPLSFEVNQGQTDAQVKFLSRGAGYNLFLTPTESVLVLRKAEASRPEKGAARGEAVHQHDRGRIELGLRAVPVRPVRAGG